MDVSQNQSLENMKVKPWQTEYVWPALSLFQCVVNFCKIENNELALQKFNSNDTSSINSMKKKTLIWKWTELKEKKRKDDDRVEQQQLQFQQKKEKEKETVINAYIIWPHYACEMCVNKKKEERTRNESKSFQVIHCFNWSHDSMIQSAVLKGGQGSLVVLFGELWVCWRFQTMAFSLYLSFPLSLSLPLSHLLIYFFYLL